MSTATGPLSPLAQIGRLLLSLLQSSPDGFAGLDAEGRFTFVNPAAARLLGWSADELIGQPAHDLTHHTRPDGKPRARPDCPICGVLAGGGAYQAEAEVLWSRDGSARPVTLRSAPAHSESGRLIGAVLTFRQTDPDLTRFRLVLERSSDALFITDPEGVILYVNPAFESLYGYSAQEAVGQTPRLLKSGAMSPEAYEQFWAALLDRQTVAREMINRARDGRLLTVEATANPIVDEAGRLLGFLAIQRDVTERRRIEAQLRESEARYRRQVSRLEIATQVSRAANSILDPDALLTRVADLIRAEFGYDHAGIFLIDDTREWAVLRASTGEAGRQMLERGHRLRVGQQGMVGLVAGSGEPRVAQEVSAEPAHVFNPLLPETRAEAVLPLRLGQSILGALDVQSTAAGAFQPEDVAVLQSVADQLAVALENARLFQQAERNLREMDVLYQQYAQQSWRHTLAAAEVQPDYLYVDGPDDLAGPAGAAGTVVEQAVRQRQTVSQTMDGENILAVPLLVRGEVVGVLSLYDEAGQRSWTLDDQTLAEAAAGQIAQSLEVGRLFDRTARQAQREKLVSEITSQIRAAGSVDEMLRAAVSQLRQALGVSHGMVRLAAPLAAAAEAPPQNDTDA